MNLLIFAGFAAYLVFVAALFLGISLVLSHVSGWGKLAIRYRRTGPVEGTTWSFQSVQFGKGFYQGHYGSCITVVANSEGLGLSVLPLFRPGHPPLFIPWSDICVQQKKQFLVFNRVGLSFTTTPSVLFWISERLAKRIQAAAGLAWFEEDADEPQRQQETLDSHQE